MKTITKTLKLLAVFFLLISGKNALAQTCTASFNSQNVGGGVINFTNTSIGTNTSGTVFYWTFGDGSPTFTATGGAGWFPSHTYSVNGTYTVTLFVMTVPTCSAQGTGVVTVTNAVGGGCALVAHFNASTGWYAVNFTNNSTGTNGGSTYAWNFGDGGTSTQMSPQHTYAAGGQHLVTLTVTNSATCISTYTAMVYSCPPITLSYTLGPNGLVTLNNTTPSNTLTTYGWTVTNSGIGYNQVVPTGNQTYSFSAPANGVYTVSAYYSNGLCGGVIVDTVHVVNITGPSCFMTVSGSPATGSASCNGSATVTNVSGLCGAASYTWMPGGLTGSSVSGLCPGVYTVTASGGGGTNCCVSIQQTVAIGVSPPVNTCSLAANFSFSVLPNGVVNFYNTSTGTASNSTYWYHSAGTPTVFFNGTTPNFTYTFTANGSYTVKLMVTNPGMTPLCQDSVTKVVNVNSIAGPCNLAASFSHTVGASGNVNFANTSTGTNANTVYYWNYGDGSVGFGANPGHTYASAGTYVVIFTAINNSVTCFSTASMAINVTGINCVANSNFSVAPTNTAQYWTATPAFPWNVTNAVWSWGDGSSSNGMYSSHSYSASGNYQICLSVTVSCGSTSSTCATYSISKTNMNMIQINVVEPELFEVGINENATAISAFQFYPNPSSGLLKLEMSSKRSEAISLQVFDLTGRVVYSNSIEAKNENISKDINLQSLPNGVYLLQVEQAGQSLSKKLIISKD